MSMLKKVVIATVAGAMITMGPSLDNSSKEANAQIGLRLQFGTPGYGYRRGYSRPYNRGYYRRGYRPQRRYYSRPYRYQRPYYGSYYRGYYGRPYYYNYRW